MWFRTVDLSDAEMDVENLPIIGIERFGCDTNFMLEGTPPDMTVRCTVDKHNDFIARFRAKLKAKQTKETNK